MAQAEGSHCSAPPRWSADRTRVRGSIVEEVGSHNPVSLCVDGAGFSGCGGGGGRVGSGGKV